MRYTDDYFIAEIQAGGHRQERGIRRLYEQFLYMAKQGRQRYRSLGDDEVLSAYNLAVIALRNQLVGGTFRGESSISTYLTRIYSNKCIDLLRSKNARPTEPLESARETTSEEDSLKNLILSDQITRVMEQLQQLGEPCKQILLDSDYWGYSAEEIAQRIGFSNAASVNSKKYTCLQKLRQALLRNAET